MIADRPVQASADALQAFVSSLPTGHPGSMMNVGLAIAYLENPWFIASLDAGQQIGLTTHTAAELVIAAHRALTDGWHHGSDDILDGMINVFEWAMVRASRACHPSPSSMARRTARRGNGRRVLEHGQLRARQRREVAA